MAGIFLVGISFVLENDGKILLGKRASYRDFQPDVWEIPAGRMENGESPEEAVRREGMEELSVELEPKSIIDAYTFERIDREMVLITYHCNTSGSPKISKEHDELGWFDPEEARELVKFPEQKKTIDKFIQYFNRLQN